MQPWCHLLWLKVHIQNLVSSICNLRVLLDFSWTLSFHIAASASNTFYNCQLAMRLYPILTDEKQAQLYMPLSFPIWITAMRYARTYVALCLLSNYDYCIYITPVLHSLYKLPIEYQVRFKVSHIISKTLNNLGPAYLKD